MTRGILFYDPCSLSLQNEYKKKNSSVWWSLCVTLLGCKIIIKNVLVISAGMCSFLWHTYTIQYKICVWVYVFVYCRKEVYLDKRPSISLYRFLFQKITWIKYKQNVFFFRFLIWFILSKVKWIYTQANTRTHTHICCVI